MEQVGYLFFSYLKLLILDKILVTSLSRELLSKHAHKFGCSNMGSNQ